MGTQGVATTVTEKALRDTIKKRKGVATDVQDDLKIGHNTFYKLIEKFNLKEFLNDHRNAYSERMCDIAEDVLIKGMLQTADLGCAVGAAKYVLNNKGRHRGYYPPVPPPEIKNEVVNDLRQGIKQISQESGSEETVESEVEIESSL
jgi:hypothetical protein